MSRLVLLITVVLIVLAFSALAWAQSGASPPTLHPVPVQRFQIVKMEGIFTDRLGAGSGRPGAFLLDTETGRVWTWLIVGDEDAAWWSCYVEPAPATGPMRVGPS